MSELSRTIGAGVNIDVCGREYTVSPIRLRHIGLAQNEMRKSSPPVLREVMEAAAGMPAEVYSEMFKIAVEKYAQINTIPVSRALDWLLYDPVGTVYLLFILVKESCGSQTSPTREDVADWYGGLDPDEAANVVSSLLAASGGDRLGNGQSPSTVTG